MQALNIPPEVMARIRRHAEETYPEECCGILVGSGDAVIEAVPAANLASGRRDRYLIDPRAVLLAQRQADQRRLDIVGFYHSHPDHPARPSAVDRDQAWPVYWYIIVEVRAGQAAEAKAFQLDASGWRSCACP